ncbi:hypothetical protein POSPLADRAFT_1062983 [Postia placenta MAD-698-R-SB12]|uniref:Uncharacterized protein n=1 Tax=Postia placenta MAD-698-R-SB12 TaxID=670580 RepID=A0A1X6MI61_9APHY|nr:hypothetical protein POSPLADRAFT_1062983 [Postia placenta MAD-698-R-SB12]OSX56084.1 hypothetical protein POSPLADRAFT_1062983 [Postia placenta MAD-698-R-SB12]
MAPIRNCVLPPPVLQSGDEDADGPHRRADGEMTRAIWRGTDVYRSHVACPRDRGLLILNELPLVARLAQSARLRQRSLALDTVSSVSSPALSPSSRPFGTIS